jgi:hypothetical protein
MSVTSREIVTKKMHDFREQGYLSFSRRGISLNRAALNSWLKVGVIRTVGLLCKQCTVGSSDDMGEKLLLQAAKKAPGPGTRAPRFEGTSNRETTILRQKGQLWSQSRTTAGTALLRSRGINI